MLFADQFANYCLDYHRDQCPCSFVYSHAGAAGEGAALNGALKMAPIPPAAPANNIIRRSRSSIFKRDPIREANPEPIWAMGPLFLQSLLNQW